MRHNLMIHVPSIASTAINKACSFKFIVVVRALFRAPVGPYIQLKYHLPQHSHRKHKRVCAF